MGSAPQAVTLSKDSAGTTANVDRLYHMLGTETDVLELLRSSSLLAAGLTRATDPGAHLDRLGRLADVDRFGTLAAIEALSRLRHSEADRRLVGLLSHVEPVVRRHAAWRLGDRPVSPDAHRPLTDLLAAGGIGTMHAYRTLKRWSAVESTAVAEAILGRLQSTEAPAERIRLVDALGAIADPIVDSQLLRLAADGSEAATVRIAAVGALGQRPGLGSRGAAGAERLLRSLSRREDELGVHAAIAYDDLLSRRAEQPPRPADDRLRVAQLTIAGELDRDLTRGGLGDTGGVASLLVSLGEALAARDDIAHVLTIGRGTLTAVMADQLMPDRGKLAYGTLAIGDEARPADSPADCWEHLPAIERGLSRIIRSRATVDLLHLRMADAGTVAGMDVAARLGIETCFSLAPDPHNVIQSQQAQGRLDRHSFVDLAGAENTWFRARLVEHMARGAGRLALFPRSEPLAHFDLAGPGGVERPSVVVPEGIDLELVDRAEHELEQIVGRPGRTPKTGVLADLAAAIPTHRSNLPLLVSVGRLNPIKGMDRVASAWAGDPDIHGSCTLVIVGGSLDDPSPVEAGVLAAIDRAVPPTHPAREGLVLLGGRPRFDVAVLLAAARAGLPGHWAPNGTYVDGAHKEEFGLALIEALVSGLVVTAPNRGGPPTYVEHGNLGILVDPSDDLGPALLAAFGLVDRPGRVEQARRLVEDRYSVSTMADRLLELYLRQPTLP